LNYYPNWVDKWINLPTAINNPNIFTFKVEDDNIEQKCKKEEYAAILINRFIPCEILFR